MDSPSFSNDENKWVEDRIARLSPPPGWKPDPDRAFERVMQEERAASTSRGLRISLAAATLVLIAAILTLLPWNVLWTPRAAETIVAAQEPTTPAQTDPEPPKTDAVTTAAPPQAVTVQDDLKDLFVGEKDANNAKAQVAPAQLPPQELSRSQEGATNCRDRGRATGGGHHAGCRSGSKSADSTSHPAT